MTYVIYKNSILHNLQLTRFGNTFSILSKSNTVNQRPSLLTVHVPRHYFDTCLLQKKINNFCNSSPPPAIIAVYVLYQKCIVGLICPDLAARRVKKRFAAYKNATNYRTGAIIARGLYILNPLFEGQQPI